MDPSMHDRVRVSNTSKATTTTTTNRRHCSDKHGNTGLTLLTDTKNPLTASIREKYTAKVYVIYSTFSKQAATHLELCIQQILQSIIPGHILNRGTSTISYQHASVEYDVSSKVYRVYVTVLEGVRHAIDKGLVTFNYWKMSDTSTTNQLDDVESTREENKRLKERICTLEEENRILKRNIGYRIPMRVRTDTNNSLISILQQRVRRSTSPTRFDLQWQSRYHELKDYNTLNKHTNVPHDYPKNQQLSTWVNNQREQYKYFLIGKKSTMTTERINLLNAIGFAWSSGTMRIKWQLMYAELVEYKIVNGNTTVPFDYPQLGRWVITQRTQYKLSLRKKKSYMTTERIELLEKIGFRWRVKREIIPID